jgi:hypothetical protein
VYECRKTTCGWLPFDAAKAKLKKRVRWCKKIRRQHASLSSGGGCVEAGVEQPPFGGCFLL